MDSIVVRGSKDDKGYAESPESVSILQEHEISTTGRENDVQVLNAVPNVSVNKNGESFSIRGISNTGVTGYQKDNLSSIVIDDLFQTDLALQAGTFDLWDMERIEVLRGAQSTSQGANSLAGTILLDHRRPQFSDEGLAKIGVGSFGFREVGVLTNNAFGDQTVATRISYSKELSDGFTKNVATNNRKWGGWDKDRFRLGVAYKFANADILEFNSKLSRNDQGGTYVQGIDPFRHEVNEDVDYRSHTENTQVSTHYTHRINANTTNITILGFSKSNQDNTSDADGTPNNTAGKRVESHGDQFVSFENRLQYKNENFSNIFGLHAHEFRAEDDYDFNLLYPIGSASTPIAVLQGVERQRTSYALFDSWSYYVSEHHEILGGLRGEHVEASYGTTVHGERTQDLGANANQSIDTYLKQISGTYQGTKDDIVLLPKIGYSYHNGLHHSGVLYTKGYRTAGVSINRSRAIAVSYDPEFTHNYEIWYRYVQQLYQIGANVFYTDWRHQQVQVQLSNDFYDTEVQNAARSEVHGAELEGKVRITERHALHAGAGYVDTKFKTFTVGGVDYSGNHFPFASTWTGRVSHEAKVSESFSSLVILRYLSDAYTNAENTHKADEQLYLDWNGKYAFGSWLGELYVNNVLNAAYQTFDGTPTSATSPYQASYHQTSKPREMGVRVNYYW